MKLPLLLSLLASPIVFSQTTITKAFNDPVVGNSVTNKQVIGTVNNTGSGAGTTYNNATLTGGPAVAITYASPTPAEIASYPNSTIKAVDAGNTTFYKQSATKLEITGIVNATATLSFSGDNATAMVYPMAFGNAVADNAKGTFTSTAASGLFKGTVNLNADANGTLIIGANTYTNILRVKVTQAFKLYQTSDTMYLFSIGDMNATSYQYYNATSKFPLLNHTDGSIIVPLASINQTTSEAVAQGFTFLGAQDFQFIEEVSIFPNPAQDFIKIQSKDNLFHTANIITMEGRMVKKMELKTNLVSVSDLQPGTYVLELLGKNTVKKLKFIKN